jgi:hypothetical protein
MPGLMLFEPSPLLQGAFFPLRRRCAACTYYDPSPFSPLGDCDLKRCRVNGKRAACDAWATVLRT